MGNMATKAGIVFDDSKLPSYTMEQVHAHATEQSAWTVIHGHVFNVTPFIHEHPGGSAIMEAAGKDGTELFEGQGHSKDAAHILTRLVIGKLAPPGP